MEIPEGPFALLRREGRDHVEILTGTVETASSLAELPLRDDASAGPDVLALVPYRQVRERGFEAVDDGAALLYLPIGGYAEAPVDEVLAGLPSSPPRVRGGAFDVDDASYARIVEDVLRDEIGRGEGSNFVIHRVFEASVDGDPLAAALAAFARLLRDERGAYWTFLVHTGSLTFVGATPERHVSVDDGLVMMNPISGTYRHPAGGPDRDELLAFLADRKETDELYMVLDEELKMMATVADRGGQVVGPYLKQMAHLTHTEYLLVGRGSKDAREVLRETMFAPTVVGSPIENACRVVARHEQRGRGYYGGVLALIGRDTLGRQTLDAPILIRTAVFSAEGELRVPVGATLVRHSTPEHEVAETYAKAAGVMAALGLRGSGDASAPAVLVADDQVQAGLARRNDTLASFWLEERVASPVFDGRRVLVVDAEDTFTGMLAHQLRALGFGVTLRSYREDFDREGFDLVVVGPGPGDPGDLADPKIFALDRLVRDLLAARQPMLAICLGHQVLAGALGLPLHRKDSPYQGMQREIDFFGRAERVGFYSTYTAVCSSAFEGVEVSRDQHSGEVHALRGPTFAGVQFHPESVLTEHGIDLLRELVAPLLYAGRSPLTL
ncbi:anthranilate synthase family protein [Planosporangium flavigriseum]|uniref:anthranilate synthase n=1 Tax=Planosporangium flavigriseum TaxID=373681 RepID=A0A8J3LQN9_9ACTN|nr:anthranilate synthase family protein [Planosporangium flavigriseum]GIG76222.1 phenazine-specific anthranilate synthase component I [Planosporangium flavigriseum]